MTNKVLESLELLENKIEGMKWLISTRSFLKKTEISHTINAIRKSAGILSKSFPKGTSFENNTRRQWGINFSKRMG